MTTTHPKTEWRTLGDALKQVNGKATFIPYSESRAEIFKLIPEGANWRHIRDHHGDEMLREVMGGAYSADGGRVGFYRRLSRKKPSPTLPTSPIQKSTALCHPTELRPLSVEEYQVIQQFPYEWDFAGSVASRYRQIGNAVPVGLGEAIGRALVGVMEDRAPKQRRLLERQASRSDDTLSAEQRRVSAAQCEASGSFRNYRRRIDRAAELKPDCHSARLMSGYRSHLGPLSE